MYEHLEHYIFKYVTDVWICGKIKIKKNQANEFIKRLLTIRKIKKLYKTNILLDSEANYISIGIIRVTLNID